MSEWSDIIQNIAVIVGCVTAVYGLDTWRREFYFRKRFELAEEVLPLFYEARDAIRAIRSPLSFASEGKSRTPEYNETQEQTSARNQAYIVFERYNRDRELFNNLNAKRYRFMAIFGNETEPHFNAINEILNSIFSASRILAHYWEKDSCANNTQVYEDIFWHSGDENDQIEQKLAAAINMIEAICRKELNLAPSFWNKAVLTISKKKRNLLSRFRPSPE